VIDAKPTLLAGEHHVKQYRHRGKWYEVEGEDGRPEWAEGERTVVVKKEHPRTSRRSTGNWRTGGE
jgi:hypothetical protein